MPVYTKAQSYAISMLRRLRSVRHDQMHWLIDIEYPGAKIPAATEMRRLNHLGRAVNDGKYYYWPGCGLDTDLIIALDIMRRASGRDKPVFEPGRPPHKLAFSVIKGEKHLACGVFFPKPGEEQVTVAEVEQLPSGQTAVIFLESREQMPRFRILRPHIFVCLGADGGYEYIGGRDERMECD